MLELREVMSDDQIAVMGCLFALCCCLALTAFSFHLGGADQAERSASSLPLRRQEDTADAADRRAA